jgi:hypothetical protein
MEENIKKSFVEKWSLWNIFKLINLYSLKIDFHEFMEDTPHRVTIIRSIIYFLQMRKGPQSNIINFLI